MPGVREISDVVDALQRAERTSLHVLPLHGQLSSAAQREVFKPTRRGLTKAVVATNIAEGEFFYYYKCTVLGTSYITFRILLTT